MRCPNCFSEQTDGFAECARCGLIFAKWRPPEERRALAIEHAVKEAEKHKMSPMFMWIAVAACALGAWEITRDKTLVNEASSLGAQEQNSPYMQTSHDKFSMDEQSPESIKFATADAAPGMWRFYGRILDLYRLKPVSFAKVTYYSGLYATSDSPATTTDIYGRYAVEIPKKDGGYSVHIDHADYRRDHVDGDWEKVGRAVRLRTGCPRRFRRSGYVGVALKSTRLDFAVCPKILTAEEQAALETTKR